MSKENVSAQELATLFVDSLDLQDVNPTNIDLTGSLFGSGLGLDSLDMLEIALVIEQRFGVKLRADDPNVENIFGSLQSLADYINQYR
ncbi:phosphopantetheine-binding protein [Paenalcaligenes hominis]|uniref:phosphopantetheine-binding protein n=1 Tax=Paenalcaligenes hominis TaxID=643674 RepID=UPI00352612DF